MKAVKKTGLVPVVSAKTGEVFGVSPNTALAGVKFGAFSLAEIPEDIETVNIGGESEDVREQPVETEAPEIPEDWESLHKLQRIKLAMSIDPSFKPIGDESAEEKANAIIREAVGGDEDFIDIPEDWESLHHNKRIALAEEISGEPIELTDEEKSGGVKKSDKADLIIIDELEQRAAAET